MSSSNSDMPQRIGIQMPQYHRMSVADSAHDDRLAEFEKREADRKAREIDDRLINSGMPKRLINATFDNFATPTTTHASVLTMVHGFASGFKPRTPPPARSMILFGPPGTGKTHLACAVMRNVAPYFGVRYVTVSQLARAVRSTYHRSATETEQDVLDAHVKPSLLVVDEVGIGLGTDHERAMLHDVIAGRYDAMRPTIMLSNLGINEIKASIGERIIDRVKEDNGLVLQMVCDSYRGTAK